MKYLLLSLVAMTTLLSSCKKTEIDELLDPRLVGNWRFEERIFNCNAQGYVYYYRKNYPEYEGYVYHSPEIPSSWLVIPQKNNPNAGHHFTYSFKKDTLFLDGGKFLKR